MIQAFSYLFLNSKSPQNVWFKDQMLYFSQPYNHSRVVYGDAPQLAGGLRDGFIHIGECLESGRVCTWVLWFSFHMSFENSLPVPDAFTRWL